MRPVPVVLLLLAFCPHSYPRVLAAGYPQLEHVFFCLWNDTLPQRMHPVCVFVWRLPNDCVPLVCVEKVLGSVSFSLDGFTRPAFTFRSYKSSRRLRSEDPTHHCTWSPLRVFDEALQFF
jgi:hypothetical protein